MKAFLPPFQKIMNMEGNIISQAKKVGEFIKVQRATGLEIINPKTEADKTQMSKSVSTTEHTK